MRGGTSTGAAGDGVYRYRTSAGVRWRFVFRRADGRLSSRRGYATRAAAATARRELIEMLRADAPATDKAVPRPPHVAPELDYLRIEEIDRYLDACAGHYRPLAELLIGAGRTPDRRTL